MPPGPSPLLGYNNNVRHKGKLYHIQTEDSGVNHPHIITHLFADGGRIIASRKTEYRQHLGAGNLQEIVKKLMQEQHKAMFIALRDGQLDHLLDEGGPQKAVPPATPSTPELPPEPPPAAAPEPPPAAPPAPPPEIAAPPEETATPPSRRVTSRPKLQINPDVLHARGVVPPTAQGVVPRRTPPEGAIDLDLDALERAAAEAQTPFFQQINDLPPPPAAVLGKKPVGSTPSGTYSVTPVSTGTPVSDPSSVPRPSPAARPPPVPPPVQPAPPLPPGTGRYAASRPAAIFATSRPQEGASIFGEDLISEKSLDEVILSYLAEDLDTPSEKK